MKKIVSFFAVVILVFSGLYIYQRSLTIVNKQATRKISVGQSITLRDKEAKFTIYKVDEGRSALDLLKEHSEVATRGEGTNAFVISINGKEALSVNKEYWAFYVNGKPATAGSGSYKLKEGDKIEWRIEKY